MKNSSLSRLCPVCGKTLYYSSKSSLILSTKNKSWCGSCRSKEISSRPERAITHNGFLERFCSKGVGTGASNPFWRHRHSEESKKKMLLHSDRSIYKTDAFRAKISSVTSGALNPMHGRTPYEIWVEKFGREEADKRETERRLKISLAMSGAGNPMYGQSSPQGSGNGWSGWYNGWFFRSLKELSYVVLVLDPKGQEWVAFESLGIKIPYKAWDGKERTYVPDFMVGDKTVVEVKPRKLNNSSSVIAKTTAAKLFCALRGWEYVLVDPPVLTDNQIARLRLEGKIVFTSKYEQLFITKYAQLTNPSVAPNGTNVLKNLEEHLVCPRQLQTP